MGATVAWQLLIISIPIYRKIRFCHLAGSAGNLKLDRNMAFEEYAQSLKGEIRCKGLL